MLLVHGEHRGFSDCGNKSHRGTVAVTFETEVDRVGATDGDDAEEGVEADWRVGVVVEGGGAGGWRRGQGGREGRGSLELRPDGSVGDGGERRRVCTPPRFASGSGTRWRRGAWGALYLTAGGRVSSTPPLALQGERVLELRRRKTRAAS
jgi:hypothetical protein